MIPELGTIAIGRDIGREGSTARRKFVWAKCPKCETERWVRHDGTALQTALRYCKRCVAAVQSGFRYGFKVEAA